MTLLLAHVVNMSAATGEGESVPILCRGTQL